jgi:hypothetical protein
VGGRPEVRVLGFWVAEVVEAGGGNGDDSAGGGVRVTVRVRVQVPRGV